MKRFIIGFARLVAAYVAVQFNHGLHGCGSRTCLRTLRVRRCRMFPPKQSFFGASTLPNISRRQALAQPIRVIRGTVCLMRKAA